MMTLNEKVVADGLIEKNISAIMKAI